MSQSNRTLITIAAESTQGTSPGESGTWGTLRTLSDSLKADATVQQSDEIRNMRDIRDLHWTDKSASGSISLNQYYDDNATAFLQLWAIGSSGWSNSGGDLSVSSGSLCAVTQSTKTIALATGTFVNDPSVGDWVYISGSTDAATNGYHKVATVATSNTITVESAIGVDEASVSLTIVALSSITNGNSLITTSIQRAYNDLSNESELFTGMGINGWNFASEGQETMKQSFDFMGFYASSNSTLISADAAASTNPSMVSPKHMDWIREGSTPAGVAALGVSFSAQSNLRKQYEQGTFGAKALVQGDFIVTGTLRAYFATSTLFDKFLNQTDSSLAFAARDGSTSKGNANIYDFPSVRFTDGRRVAGGRNQDIIADMSWQARYASADAYTMKVSKIASA